MIADSGRGVTIDGNGQFIDIRTSAYKGYSLSTLYTFGFEGFGIDYCFLVSQNYSASYPATVIRNLWMKGFKQAIRTSSGQAHPLTIASCDFRRNQWGVYLSGMRTTVTGLR